MERTESHGSHNKSEQQPVAETRVETKVDIEHVPVMNDPRLWSPLEKVSVLNVLQRKINCTPQTTVLLLISSASMIVGIVSAIQNRRYFLQHVRPVVDSTLRIHSCSPGDGAGSSCDQ